MPPDRCREPACGRFIAAGTELCPRHSPEGAGDDVLEDGIRALRHLLSRLMEEKDLDTQAKYIPRASSVAIQAARARHQMGERRHEELFALIGIASEELDRKIVK